LALVRAAILAANPHNTQPWLFKVTGRQIELHADRGRNLGSFDPYLREMHIGLGCALENLVLAAPFGGYRAVVTLPEGRLGPVPAEPEPTLVARIDLSPGKQEQSRLYDAIPRRHTNRSAYDSDRSPSMELISAVRRMAGGDTEIQVFLYTTEEGRAKCGEAVITATQAIIADRTMVLDSEEWFRHSWADVQKFRDGPTLDAAGLSPLMTTIAKMLPPSSPETNHRFWLDSTRKVHVPTAPVFGLIAVRDLYDRAQTLRAGRLWQRMHLWATTEGIAMHPLNQPVEMVDRERQLGGEPRATRALSAITGDPAWKPTFFFRMGYPNREARPSPRRPVESVVL
jgi:nitroreductase